MKKFYVWYQNNPHGETIENENTAKFMVFEAESEDLANKMAWPILSETQSRCSCCGERWDEEEHYTEFDSFGELVEFKTRYWLDESMLIHLNDAFGKVILVDLENYEQTKAVVVGHKTEIQEGRLGQKLPELEVNKKSELVDALEKLTDSELELIRALFRAS